MTLRRGLVVAVLLAEGLGSTGCTVFFVGSGLAADHAAPKPGSTLTPAQLERLPTGTGVQLLMTDGTRIGGTFRGLRLQATADYATRYARASAELAADEAPPALGPGATVLLADNRRVQGAFVGVGPDNVLIHTPPGLDTVLSLDEVQFLSDAAGRRVSSGRLRTLVESHRLPSVAALVIEAAGHERRLAAADDIVAVEVVSESDVAGRGMLAGLALDAAIVGLFYYALTHWWH